MEAREGIPILPISMVFPLPMPPKAIVPPSIGFRSRNIDLSPIMCHEKPLSRSFLGLFLPRISAIGTI